MGWEFFFKKIGWLYYKYNPEKSERRGFHFF